MAFRIILPFRTSLSIGVGLSAAYAASALLGRPRGYRLACDNGTSSIGLNEWPVSRDTRTPVFSKGGLNAGAVRQMSSGSILGQCIAGSLVRVWLNSLGRTSRRAGSEHLLQDTGFAIWIVHCGSTGTLEVEAVRLPKLKVE